MPDRSATRPKLASSDLHDRVREAAFALLLADRRPAASSAIAAMTGATDATLQAMLDELAGAGWIDRDDHGRVTGSAGLSLTTGPHRLQIDGTTFRTWCAYDSIGIVAALSADARIETECPVCAIGISVEVRHGQSAPGRPERLWLADGGEDLRRDFCSPTVLLCSTTHAEKWAHLQGGRGRAVELGEAADLGREAWAGCARAATELRERQP